MTSRICRLCIPSGRILWSPLCMLSPCWAPTHSACNLRFCFFWGCPTAKFGWCSVDPMHGRTDAQGVMPNLCPLCYFPTRLTIPVPGPSSLHAPLASPLVHDFGHLPLIMPLFLGLICLCHAACIIWCWSLWPTGIVGSWVSGHRRMHSGLFHPPSLGDVRRQANRGT